MAIAAECTKCRLGRCIVLNHLIARAEPLVEQVYQYLRNQILTGAIEPGSKIVESKLAKQLTVSRSPVREAIRRLEQEGLVVTKQGVTTLFKPSQQDFEDLYELRLAVEPMAARLAAKHITEEDGKRLEAILQRTDECIKAGLVDGFIESNTQFHDLIVSSSRNARLQKVLSELSALTRYYRYICFRIFRRRLNSVDEHWQIYHAICEKNEQAAWGRMAAHLEGDLAYIQSIGQLEERVQNENETP